VRADDASTVPVVVKAQMDQTEKEYIKSIYVIVERNPSPAAGVFHFTPQSGRAQVETRLRFEDYSFVRAVAEMNDGSLYMAQRWVKRQAVAPPEWQEAFGIVAGQNEAAFRR
jgi:sulfur-oxidizing protein SoxY